ncbi:NAD(P)-dependent oxidoreductase [Longimicrobium sp.]|uniref:NAD-dependent epimerase/dehydratase family protein n=1 Tax=Longimicrobium sp. TaxID=2029185 RepID=UPI002CD0D27A|nr:NAD(P)-dependent oxidoreductase [Longimicrobium sp.]HSU14791.1 NAD(P)-dependent oxidoreductase [Longimicrobium sp.]
MKLVVGRWITRTAGAMDIFVTGATGVLGRPVVRLLKAAGYRVRALSRSASNDAMLRRMGAEPARGTLFDAAALGPAMAGTTAVLHLATRIPPRSRSRAPGAWAENDRIRTEGTRALVDAALAGGVETLLYPGVCFVYADGGGAWIDAQTGEIEAGPLLASTLAAEAEVRRFAAAGRRGIVLRMGYFYAPEAESTLDTLALARRGAAILAGPGDAFYPSIWVDDAAAAVLAALRAAPAGVYDVVDDEPLTRRELARTVAEAAGRPFVVRPPVWLLKLAGGREAGFLARSQRVSNARFRAATGWAPAVRDAREGWQRVSDALRQPQPMGE